jgi:hypothetical protein
VENDGSYTTQRVFFLINGGGAMRRIYVFFFLFGVFFGVSLVAEEGGVSEVENEEIIILTLQKIRGEQSSVSACSISFYSMLEDWVKKINNSKNLVEVREESTEGQVQRVTTYLKGEKTRELVYENAQMDKLSCLKDLSRENFSRNSSEHCLDVEKWELRNGRI